MKNILFCIIFLGAFKTYSQDFNDRIYPKEGDSILCKITLVKTNWIYYDHRGKKGMRNDYIHMSDLKSYVYNGIRRKVYEYEAKTSPEPKNFKDTIPKDTVSTFYSDSLGKKRTCFILLTKGTKLKSIQEFGKIKIIDSLGNLQVLFPNQISGYWLNGTFHRSFKIIYKSKKINFFAKELEKGKAELYFYDGEELEKKSVYIFKKQSDSEFNFVEQNISKKSEYGRADVKFQSGGTFDGTNPMTFYDEEPYLQYFQSYFSDCNEVALKFKSKWYSYSSVTTMFSDYNKCK